MNFSGPGSGMSNILRNVSVLLNLLSLICGNPLIFISPAILLHIVLQVPQGWMQRSLPGQLYRP